MQRVDPTVNFDWGTGALTTYGRDYVSIRWSGKVVATTTEEYTFYLEADDGVRLWLDHELVLDAWETCCVELRINFAMVKNRFADIRLEYKEEVGTAAVRLQWSSPAILRQVRAEC